AYHCATWDNSLRSVLF
nr:immunoglobulin light chain junction region [Macaca mulatta]MOV95011.1 immunoglobulin light chain junction region [Macaca mulatta]MOV95256.1 immunoglobulin light chain junction region [Macaca mulatta]MOV95541.1 immunoglobulin light chain junction region [Macaca mulatta]MOV97001.1 immunoglobulin light chain junction region [Macaca mulatta]